MKFIPLLFILFSTSLLAQQPTITQINGTSAVNNVLVGNGIQTSNITFNGIPTQLGYFTHGNAIGIDTGIVLTTGVFGSIPGNVQTTASTNMQSTVTDADILTLMQQNSSQASSANDAAILTFDFIPKGDTIEFEYVFGSEEYPEFVCNFNDGFAMFLSGPGINGTFSNGATNLALVPGTNIPVSISTVNMSNAGCAQANSNASLYVDNLGNNGNFVALDGYTKVFKARHAVQCGQTYTLKIVIADCNDKIYDSGVFLKARSLNTNGKDYSISTTFQPSLSGFSEKCGTATFTITRPAPFTQALSIPVTFAGIAINNTDYTASTSTVNFAAGQQTANVVITPIVDNLAEGQESLVLSIPSLVCPALFNVTSTIYIKDYVPLVAAPFQDTLSKCAGSHITLFPVITGGVPASFSWSTGSNSSSLNIVATTGGSQYYSCTVMSACNLDTITDSIYVQVLDTNGAKLTVTNHVQFETCPIADTMVITLQSPVAFPILYPITIIGTATNSSDYTYLDTVVQLLPGVLNYYFPYNIIQDGLNNDPTETIIMSIGPQPNMCVCSHVSSQTVTIYDSLNFNIHLDDAVVKCMGQSISLSPSHPPFGQIHWQPFNYIGNSMMFSYSSQDTTTIYLEIADTVCGQYLTAYDTAQVISLPFSPPQLVGPLNSTIRCNESNYPLEASVIGGYPQYHFTWFDANNNLLSTADSIVQTVVQSTHFKVIVSDLCNNKDTLVVTVTKSPQPELILDSSPNYYAVCPNETVHLSAQLTGGIEPYSYVWSNNQVGDTITVSANDSLVLMVTAKDSCSTERRKFIYISPPNYRVPTLSLSADTTICPNHATTLSTDIQGGVATFNYEYFVPANNSKNVIATGSIESLVKQSGYYVVKVTDACNSSVKDSIYVHLFDDCTPRTYNVFTKNEDGSNSAFKIDHIEEYPNTHVIIYDRWGVRVYESNNYSNENPWRIDGVDAGTLYYVIDYDRNLVPENYTQTGFIQVIK
jgi:gliding motility-associated-like protein